MGQLPRALGEARATEDSAPGSVPGDLVRAANDLGRAIEAAREAGWRAELATNLCHRARALGDRDALAEAEQIADAIRAPLRSRLRRDLARTRSQLGRG